MSGASDNGNGRLVAIVGGAHGIGEATATLLASRGWRLAVADLDVEGARATASRIGGTAVEVDVLDAGSIGRAAESIEREGGPVYGLVNAAALFQRREPPESLPQDEWDRIVAAGHRGTYVGMVEFGRRMAARGAGAIVNISSMVGERPNHGHAYCSAKAAVNALTEGFAGEWGRSGVRVNAVSPGFVGVPRMLENIRAGKRYAVSPAELAALGRLVEPGEVAESIAFLLSDRASGITGANLLVDAGVFAAGGWAVNGGVPPARVREG